MNLQLKEFFEVDSWELYYFIGFCFGDGNIHKNSLKIELDKRDIIILEIFYQWLGMDRKPYVTNRNTVLFKITDKILINFIRTKFNLKENKTYDYEEPIIPQKYFSAFLLGIIDADGFVYKNQYMRLTGNKDMLKYIYNRIPEIFDGTRYLCSYSDNNVWCKLSVNGAKQVKKFSDAIDAKASLLYERKWKKLYD